MQALKDQSDALSKQVEELKQQQTALEAQVAEKTELYEAKDRELAAKQATVSRSHSFVMHESEQAYQMDRWRAAEKENVNRFKKRMADANEREKEYQSSTATLNAKIAELEEALKAQQEAQAATASAAPEVTAELVSVHVSIAEVCH